MRTFFLKDFSGGGKKLGMVRRWKGERERQRQTETEKQRDRKREIETDRETERENILVSSFPSSFQCYPAFG